MDTEFVLLMFNGGSVTAESTVKAKVWTAVFVAEKPGKAGDCGPLAPNPEPDP
jgi:hypothetical protein